MKFISISVVLVSVASVVAAEERGLQLLTKRWNITDPSFTYEALGFDLDYQVSDFISDAMTTHTLYTSPGCGETGYVLPSSILTSNQGVLVGGAIDANNDGPGVRDQKLKIGVDPSTIKNSAIYVEDTSHGALTATIDFCVRYSILTDDEGANEVNFLESLVTLVVDLSDGFEIGDIIVAPKNKILNTANQAYLLDGYQCNGANEALVGGALTKTRNQGSVIRVCVKPDDEAVAAGMFMRSLDEFTFSRDGITQPAVIGYNQEATNGLTILSCNNGDAVCFFESVLFGAFYSTAGVVSGSGTGSMQLGAGTRLLRGVPEAAATSEFEVDLFGVKKNPHPTTIVHDGRAGANDEIYDGASSSSGVMAATALVMAGVYILV
jgi:hypothetical protein